jgi:hypothetical protein
MSSSHLFFGLPSGLLNIGFIYPIYNHNLRNISTIYIYITRLASNEIFSPSNKIHREVGRAKKLPPPQYACIMHTHVSVYIRISVYVRMYPSVRMYVYMCTVMYVLQFTSTTDTLKPARRPPVTSDVYIHHCFCTLHRPSHTVHRR